MPTSTPAPEEFGIVGSRVIERRKRKKLSRDALGQLCGVSREGIRQVEIGIRGGSIELLGRLAYHLDCSTDYLLGLRDRP